MIASGCGLVRSSLPDAGLFRAAATLVLVLCGHRLTLVAQEPQWIWSDANAATSAGTEPMVFRRVFELTQEVDELRITIAADNRYELYLNGVSLGRGESWERPERYRVRGLAQPGANVLAVRAKNDGPDPAGLAASIVALLGEQVVLHEASGESWSVAEEKAMADGQWRTSDPNPAWRPAAVLGAVGITGPWGDRVQWGQPTDRVIERSARPRQGSFEFLDGDRVTLLGGTWIERLQQDGYFETLVTSAYPDRRIRFRNLGWSGDEVTGIARAVFGSPQNGFRRLQDDLLLTAPNVIVIGYGTVEAFRGEAGLEAFERDWLRLVEWLETTGATLVFVSPMYLEDLGPPLPDPAPVNANIDLYWSKISSWAMERGHHSVDFRRPLGDDAVSASFRPDIRDRLTDDGMHFNAYGHWRTARALAARLGVPIEPWSLKVDTASGEFEAEGTEASALETTDSSVRFVVHDRRLPFPTHPAETPRGGELVGPLDRLTVTGLPAGVYGLNVDGQPTVMADAEQWAQGVVVDRGRAMPVVEGLRSTIARKNELFFHRYRPQNETYLFLFRKHEQGNNAVEIPQFDPLIEAEEARIEELKQSRSVTYELIRIRGER